MAGVSTESDEYERVAGAVLNQFRDELGLLSVGGKTKVQGVRSGTTWELDGSATTSTGKLIIEYRRYTKQKLKQEAVAAIVYRKDDCGAEAAILVSPLGLQAGAKRVAQAEKIHEVTLNADASADKYVAFIYREDAIQGIVADRMQMPTDELISATMTHADGTVEELDMGPKK